MSEIHSGVGSYVIDALDADERDEFEEHLAVCATCSQEVIELSETVAELSLLDDTAPPTALRASILSAIREVRPLPPEVAHPEVVASQPVQSVQSAPAYQPPHTAAVDELALRRQRRDARVLTLAVAAALVVALAMGGWVYSLVQQRQSQQAQAAAETQLFSAPDVKVYAATMPSGSRVSFVVSKSLNKAMFVGSNLPSAGAGKKYQLWTIDQAQHPVPDSLFEGGAGPREWFTGRVSDASALAVTIEPSAGSAQPTSAILASASL